MAELVHADPTFVGTEPDRERFTKGTRDEQLPPRVPLEAVDWFLSVKNEMIGGSL